MSLRLAVITTHPIQYYAPLFRRIAQRSYVELHVFYEWEGGAKSATKDFGFGQAIRWDIPLLKGYDYTFVPNTASNPNTQHFRGIVNPNLIGEVERWNPDAVLIFGWNYWSHLRALRHFHGRVPVFFRGDSTLLNERPGMRRCLRRILLRWVYRCVDVALYVGKHNRAYFSTHGVREEQLTWVPHAIENERFYDKDGTYQLKADKWRSELEIPEEAVIFLFAGKINRTKDPLLLLKAFQDLTDHNQKSHLVFAGSGPLTEEVQKNIHGPNIHCLGFQNQRRMPVVYRLGDVFVLPSRGDTWGLSVNEAMACGRPVVVSDKVGCGPDLIQAGRNGFVFESGNALELGKKLDLLAGDVTMRQRMGTQSSVIIEDWSIEEAARRHEAAILGHLESSVTRSKMP